MEEFLRWNKSNIAEMFCDKELDGVQYRKDLIAKSARENTKDAYEASARSVRLSSKIHRFKAMMVPVLFQNIYIPGTGAMFIKF